MPSSGSPHGNHLIASGFALLFALLITLILWTTGIPVGPNSPLAVVPEIGEEYPAGYVVSSFGRPLLTRHTPTFHDFDTEFFLWLAVPRGMLIMACAVLGWHVGRRMSRKASRVP